MKNPPFCFYFSCRSAVISSTVDSLQKPARIRGMICFKTEYLLE